MYVSPISALFAGGKSTPAKRAISGYPCLCLCFGLTQMTRTTPSRWITLHLSQIFLTDARTFIRLLFSQSCRALDRAGSAPLRPDRPEPAGRNSVSLHPPGGRKPDAVFPAPLHKSR